MSEEQTTTSEESVGGEQNDYVIKDIYPIEKARKNATNYLKSLHTRKFVNKIVSEINYSIRYHSEQGESEAQVVLSIMEIFGDYPIYKDDEGFQEVLNVVTKQFSDGGYLMFTEPISTDWGIKGIVFTVSWSEEDNEDEEKQDDEEGDDSDGE